MASKVFPSIPPFVGSDKIIGMAEDVRPIYLVIQGVKTIGFLLPGLRYSFLFSVSRGYL
jgi:hypothetical protein